MLKNLFHDSHISAIFSNDIHTESGGNISMKILNRKIIGYKSIHVIAIMFIFYIAINTKITFLSLRSEKHLKLYSQP